MSSPNLGSEFWRSFDKRAADKSPQHALKKEKEKADIIQAGTVLGSTLGSIGAYLLRSFLGKRLVEGHAKIPSQYAGLDIKNLTNQIDAGELRSNGFFHSQEEIEAMREIADLGESFMEKHKLRPDLTINLGHHGSKLRDYYNPIKHSVNLETLSPSVALHEMGHAADYKGSIPKTVLRHLPQILAATAVPAALTYGDYIKKKLPGSTDDKIIDALQKHPIAAGLTGYGIATLYPEAKASILALSHIKDMKGSERAMSEFTKSLGPAYGTYLAGALPIIAGYGIASAVHKAHQKKVRKREEHKKVAKISPNMKAFLAGAIPVGLSVGGATYYTYGTKGGKAMRDITDMQRKEKLEGEYGKAVGSKIDKWSDKTDETYEKHPGVVATGFGAGVGTLAGLLTAMVMNNMKLIK
jgi:hypothetical protein